MAPTPEKPKLLVIVGPTASGKSALALKVAQKFNGEIITADSRTIYRGMDIGTAKPTLKEQKLVSHWGIDLVEPGQTFSAAKFKDYATAKIDEIQDRRKLPILVGGTGLYIDSILFDFSFMKISRLRRLIYSSWSINKLQKEIQQRDWQLPENEFNKRHLVNAMGRKGRLGSRQPELAQGTMLVGLMPPDDVLRQRINSRAEEIFEDGIITETKNLIKKYGIKKLKRTGGISYKTTMILIDGDISQQDAKELIQTEEWQYARRQKTWFRRNKFIHWYKDGEEAFISVSRALNK